MGSVGGNSDSPESAGQTTRIGSYRLLQALGTGGMSSVFRARHDDTGLEVALKILPRALAKNPVLLQRFLREAKIAESLEHPHIVAIYDRGMEDGRYYLVLEYLSGGDLHDWIRTNGPMPVDMVLQITKGVVSGLDYAAQQGLIHRDIKPANILLTDDGTAKVTDLGLAVQLADEDERVTRDGTTVGTVDYMSPEQARDSRSTSIQSDMYSLGCTLYHLLSGGPPFAGGTVPEKLKRHATQAPPDISSIRPDVPVAVAEMLRKLLAKKPEKRFKSYQELLSAIQAIEGAGVAAGGGLYALVDDDDDEESANADFLPSNDQMVPLSTRDGLPATLPERDTRSAQTGERTRPGRGGKPLSPELDLGALAEIDSDSSPVREARGRKGQASDLLAPLSDMTRLPGPAGEPDSLRPIPQVKLAPRPGTSAAGDELRDGIVRGLLIGGSLVVFALVAAWAIRNRPVNEEAADGFGEPPAVNMPPDPTSSAPAAPPPLVVSQASRPRLDLSANWVEPSDPALETPPEEPLPDSLERGFAPAWIDSEEAAQGPVTRVSQIRDGRDQAGVPTLREALAGSPAVVELGDDGPFHELDPFLDTDRSLSIRAAQGCRPLVVLEFTSNRKPGGPESVLAVNGGTVILQGIDLVVNSDLMTDRVRTLFWCRSGTLILRDCSLTDLGTSGRPLVFARVGDLARNGSPPARLLLDRCWANGQALTAVEMMGGSAEAVLTRCAVVSGKAPAILARDPAEATAATGRKLVMIRSILASQQSLLTASSTLTAAPLTVRALGNRLARLEGDRGGASLIQLNGKLPAGVNSVIDWGGDHNTYLGWPAWLAVDRGEGAAVEVADLDQARQVWNAQESRSQQQAEPMLLRTGPDCRPRDLVASFNQVPFAEATLARVREPMPYLSARAGGLFDTLTLPAEAPIKPPDGVRELVFSVTAPPWKGDLGRFLEAQLASLETDSLVVRVKGTGRHPISPVAVPDGVSLTVEVDPPATGEPVVFQAAGPGGSVSALFSVRQGDLTFRGLNIDAAQAAFESIVRVEEGHLVLADCRILGQPKPAQGDACLISLISRTTREIPRRETVAGRPAGPGLRWPSAQILRSILDTEATALEAETGRGVIVVSESVVVASEACFRLVPCPVKRDRFEADLQLSRSTLATSHDLVLCEAWAGTPPGPDRPWLVSTDHCVLLDTLSPEAGDALALRLSPDARAQSAVFWQSRSDVYSLAPIVAQAEGPIAATLGESSLEAWVQHWGASHIINSTSLDPRPALPAGGLTPGRLDLESLRQLRPRAKLAADTGAPDQVFETRIAPPAEVAQPPSANPGRPSAPSTASPGASRPAAGAVPF